MVSISTNTVKCCVTMGPQVRFDDTNPTKEKDEYVENIIKDMKTLGLQYKTITYTSDYFPQVGFSASPACLTCLLACSLPNQAAAGGCIDPAGGQHCTCHYGSNKIMHLASATQHLLVWSILWLTKQCSPGLMQMLELGEKLIKAGVLYADDTPVEQMREVRHMRSISYQPICTSLLSV